MLETHKAQEAKKHRKLQKSQKSQKPDKPEGQAKRKAVLKTSICYDLCSTCIHAGYCGFPRDLTTPVHQCEEFDDRVETSPRSEIVSDNVEIYARAEVDDIEDEPVGLKGLCVDCVHRKTCRFPKAEGGVWYCEDYA